MRPKSETPNFELLVPSKVQLQKNGTVFQPRMISSYANLRRLSRIGKQYANNIEDTIRGRKFSIKLLKLVLLTSAARLSELPTRWSNSCQGERVKSVLTIRLLLNSEQSETDLRGIKRTSIQRQYYLASFQSSYSCAVRFSIQHGRLCSLKSVASE